MISSAVIVPEPEDLSPTSHLQKRRQSSELYSDSSKRPRLESQLHKDADGYTVAPSATSPPRRKPSITGSGAVEERKRGQRLFGALLGTLSQSSTSTAQRRRADIEKKQLGKLQQRDEELEDEIRRKREKLDAVRRKEEKVWEEQSVKTCPTVYGRSDCADRGSRRNYNIATCWPRRISWKRRLNQDW